MVETLMKYIAGMGLPNSRVRALFSTKLPYLLKIQTPAASLENLRATLTSDQVTNLRVSTDSLLFDHFLKLCMELRKVLYLQLRFYYRKRI